MMRVEEKSVSDNEVAGVRPVIVVGIPAYNEEKTIAKVILQARRCSNVIIVCDDGSTDMTAEIAEQLGADVIKHGENRGYGVALQSLFRRAQKLGADVMVTLDGDGQHDPKDIPMLVEPALQEKADIVIGSRFLTAVRRGNRIPRYRRAGIKVITRLTGVASNFGLSDAQSGFRVYSRKVLESLSLCEKGMGISVEVLMEAKRHGFTVAEVPISCNYHGLESTSTLDPVKHGVGVIMSIIRLVVERKPLVFLGIPGVSSLLLGVFFGVWMLQIYAAGGRIVTNIALASMAFALIGFFGISTAIMLYMIERLVQKTKNR